MLQSSIVDDSNAVGHGQGLDLVMRHINEGRSQSLVQLFDFYAHVDAQLGVKSRQRLVKQEYGGIAHYCTTQGNALALPAGQLMGAP